MLSNDIDKITGLTELQVQSHQKEHGFNELPSTKNKTIFQIAISVVLEPMFMLLVACGTLYLILGEPQEAVMLLGFVFVIMGITIYQERKTEKALEALTDLSSPRALVIRDGQQKRIAGRDVVPGDYVILIEGDRVPADGIIISCANLTIDESLLTGESVPVRKSPCDRLEMVMTAPGGDDIPQVFSGSLVVTGTGVAVIKSIGLKTEIGKIGKALKEIKTEDTKLQKQLDKLVRNVALVGLVLCLTILLVYGISRNDWLGGLLAGLTLAMAMVPEEFPVVMTIFLALGAWRISQKQVLTRRVPTVETLGSATVLCVDKTGTLTHNRMTVKKLTKLDNAFEIPSGEYTLPEDFHELVEYGVLASEKNPFDPMDKAVRNIGNFTLNRSEHLHEDWELVAEYPLSRELLALSNVWRSPSGKDFVISAKGAPEAISDLCHLSEAKYKQVMTRTLGLAEEGYRVLGVAKASFREGELPTGQHDFQFEFIGLLGFADPVREQVPSSIEECYRAGIKVVMITGDYPATAQMIARSIGLKNPEKYITGAELARMPDNELKEKVKETNIFARVVPEHKLRIINAFKANGEVVAMTGDGVNDAPALKAADIGIAMGGRGTDVAREASALVLLNDDFSSIVESVKVGRRIFDNLQKAMAYIVAIHVPIAGLSLLPVFFGWNIILSPVHIVFLELIIDPACSVVFEGEPPEDNVMKRPPRKKNAPLFPGKTFGISLFQGLMVLIASLAIYAVFVAIGKPEIHAKVISFTTLIVANLSLIITNRSWNKNVFGIMRTFNPALWWVVGGTLSLLFMVLYVPFLQNLFSFDTIHFGDFLIAAGVGILSVSWFEIFKLFQKR
jgi:Ca2+-transporting ATPase